MILYFTGTGNSKFAASVISDITNDDIISLNDVIKNNLPTTFHSEKPFVIVAPIYAWRFPLIIEKLIQKANFTGNDEIYFIGTMGSQSGNCDKYLEKICNEKGLRFKGFSSISMPNNYIISSVMPDEESVKKTLSTAIPTLKEIANKIATKDKIKKTDKTPLPWLLSGIVNTSFNKFAVTSKNFVVSDKCTSCKKCERFCPVNNIEIKDGKPIFKNSCVSCYGCIHRCPVEAINIKGKTENHGRYVCPEYNKDIEIV